VRAILGVRVGVGFTGLLGLLVAAALVAGVPTAQPALAEGGSYPPVGQLGGGTPTDAAIAGGYAYVAANGVLDVVDVSDPANPQMVEYCDTPGNVEDVAVVGSYAYVADGPTGLCVISIADPLHPVQVAACTTPGWATCVALAGDYAYICGSGGLRAINVANPASPVEVGSCSTPGAARRLVVSGTHAYVAADTAGLAVIDVADPANPHVVGTCDTPGTAWDVALSGSYAYVADYDGGLRVIDVSSAAAPTEAGYLAMTYPFRVTVSGSYAYVSGYPGWVRVISLSDPAAPNQVGSYNSDGYPYGVVVTAGYAYVCDASRGLVVLDLTDPVVPVEVGIWNPVGYPNSIAAAGGYAYAADGGDGLSVLDVSDPSAPELVASGDLPGTRDVAVAGGYAYALDTWRLTVMDLSSPGAPVTVGQLSGISEALAVAVAGDYAYVASAADGLRVVNISNPAAPTTVGLCDTPGSAQDVVVSGGYAYVADSDAGLRVISISDPASPVEVGSCDTPAYAYAVAVSDGYAYVADYWGGLRIIDISNPAAPVEVGALPLYGEYFRAVAVSGNLAYVAADEDGLWVVDISDPAHPVRVAYYDTPGNASNVTIAGNYVYLADSNWGVMIFPKLTDVSVAGQVRLAGTSTNIENATVAAYSGAVLKRMTVTDFYGIYRLWDLPAGTYTVKASKQGYVTQVKSSVSVGSGTTYVNFNLTVSSRLSGQVKDRDTSANVAGATVTALLGGVVRATGTTAANGIYVLDTNLPAGTYVVRASKTGYVTQTKSGISVAEGATTYVNFSIAPVLLKGQVKASASSSALAGATVAVYDGETLKATATTNASGVYEIGGVPAGTYRVVASKPTYVRQSKPGIVVTLGSTTYVNFSLQTSGILKGQVKDENSNLPLVGATVTARSGGVTWATGVTAGPFGIYEITSDLPAGSFVVIASKAGYINQGRAGIAVTAGNTTYVNFALQPD